MNLDLLGRGDTIDEYQEKVIDDVAAKPIDYETTRFSCRPNTNGEKITIHFITPVKKNASNSGLVPTK